MDNQEFQSIQKERQSLQERDVGITAFLNEGNVIKGITKSRISDFIVNEVTPQKEILYPQETQTQVQDEGQQQQQIKQQVQKELIQKKKEVIQKEELSKDQIQKMNDLLTPEIGEKLQKALSDIYNGLNPNQSEFEFNVNCPQEKEKRLEIHQFVRENLPNFDSETQDQVIRIFYTKNKSKRFQRNNNDNNNNNRKKIIFQATLFKTGQDTFNAIQNICRFLKVSTRNIGSAGLKDKRGITTQAISISMHNTNEEQFKSRIKNAKWYNMKLQNIKEVIKPIKMGDLYGNQFSVAIRLIDFKEEDVHINIQNLIKYGFINYFGMQRFGNNPDSQTHVIGKLLLQKQWEQAFELIVGQNVQNDNQVNEYKRKFLEDKTKVKEALKNISFKYKIERTVIQGYEKCGMNGNYMQAICQLNRSTRALYCHAYQSYLWNQLASIRIEKYGKKIILGDIVAKRKEFFTNSINQEKNQDDQQQREDEEQIIEDDYFEYQGINDFNICIVDQNNIDQFSINDIVIPIFGAKINFPIEQFNLKNELQQILDDLTLKNFEQINQEFFVEGGYRYLIQQTENFEYTLNKFNVKTEDILTPFYNHKQDLNDENGKYTALCMRFILQKGSYATMLIREATKLTSDFQTQIKLNQEFEKI
ncbi:pseudouridine synthase, putative [Ichthyophthirius multifiliis]|uniref:Pseudouridine synthase, putative n=1 Tax=Ichthyophthirius multifiliis TaxID=5932 RepID=G0R498_ICHMU|nr:pseudouridine synthase, putative [Ichthyophthirius multifiliis]EGR27709.1 pseudouridine synthase, putative [Ichthyophthirius multifiliis]|eukprot:XP_004025161.1 pseudouridine synthase, putative [Ichthyophthirius multifiliis]